ncbi:GNAT family N-acetyltransferase [Candidatus Sumerlaeota bacterium]|nr:GNAT family N-acetyltransferase [Candidatus Sumerlaeota bacterium]
MDDSIRIEKARPEDREAILEVMRPWNMHHVPSPEMETMDLSMYFVARKEGRVIGAAGYAILSQTVGKTTLLGVLPDLQGSGVGKALQNTRLEAMHRLGVKKVVTNSDRPATIEWLKKSYGFREVGTLKKLMSFGDPDIDRWTTLELDLVAYMKKADREAAMREYVARNEPHPLAPYPPFLVNVCLTGMIPTKKTTEFVPVGVEEIVEDAVRVADAGAQILHVHARDEDGKPTWRGDLYEKILTGIRRERPDLVLCISTSGRNWPDFERRSEALRLTGDAKPDMASLTLGSMNFPTGPSVNAPEMIQKLAQAMQENDIRPELEVFDHGMIAYAKFLERRGLLPEKKYFNLLLGSLGTASATIANLAAMVQALPENSVWAAAGIGMFQLPMNAAAIVAGGGVRVGLEDNIHYDSARKRLASNEDLVKRVVRLAAELERPLATAAQARQMVGLG